MAVSRIASWSNVLRRLVIIGFLGGPIAADANLMRIMLKRLTVTGSTLRSQTDDEKVRVRTPGSRAFAPRLTRWLMTRLRLCTTCTTMRGR